MGDNLFNSEEVQNAFELWVNLVPNYHPCDDERFYSFVNLYFDNNENVSKEDFVREAKRIQPLTDRSKRGMYQAYYKKLETIVAYLKNEKKA